MGVGNRYVQELAVRVLGDDADAWLDTPRLGLGDTPTVAVAPRSLIESGCPACIGSVADVLEAMARR